MGTGSCDPAALLASEGGLAGEADGLHRRQRVGAVGLGDGRYPSRYPLPGVVGLSWPAYSVAGSGFVPHLARPSYPDWRRILLPQPCTRFFRPAQHMAVGGGYLGHG